MDFELYQKYLGTGKHVDALRLCEQVLADDPSDANAWHLKGFVHRMLGEYKSAIAAQERSLALRPDQIPVIMALAIARQLDGDLEGSLVELRKVQAIDPYYPDAYNSAALTYEKKGDLRKAAELYEEAMRVMVASFARKMKNDRATPYVPVDVFVGEAWLQFVIKSAVKLAVDAGVESVSMPTADMADCADVAHAFGGMFWHDSMSDGKLGRLYLPNFFQTVCHELRQSNEYSLYAMNLSNVLRRLGDVPEADKWLTESRAFSDT